MLLTSTLSGLESVDEERLVEKKNRTGIRVAAAVATVALELRREILLPIEKKQ